VLAGYPLDVNEPRFDLWYPEDSTTIQVLSHDSAKRIAPRFRVLVIQAHARWSREHLALDPEAWTDALLSETRRLVGDWAGNPVWCQAHLWRHARVEADGILAAPVAIPLARGARLAVAGEVFHPGGGAQAAYLSGRALAERLAAGGDA
jgi:predicted NAD/FAD-dependent oxidoreductase